MLILLAILISIVVLVTVIDAVNPELLDKLANKLL